MISRNLIFGSGIPFALQIRVMKSPSNMICLDGLRFVMTGALTTTRSGTVSLAESSANSYYHFLLDIPLFRNKNSYL